MAVRGEERLKRLVGGLDQGGGGGDDLALDAPDVADALEGALRAADALALAAWG